jgi:hypothetical protein
MRVAGWLCALGVALMIIDLLAFLPYLPSVWWLPEGPPQLDGKWIHFDLRIMHADLGVAWLGQWGYLGSFIWLPWASLRAWHGGKAGRRARPSERILFVTLGTLLVAVSCLRHFTPLRYPNFNFFVI